MKQKFVATGWYPVFLYAEPNEAWFDLEIELSEIELIQYLDCMDNFNKWTERFNEEYQRQPK